MAPLINAANDFTMDDFEPIPFNATTHTPLTMMDTNDQQEQEASCSSAAEMDPRFALFVKLGGDYTIRAIVTETCQRVVRDEYLEYFLRGYHMDTLRMHVESVVRIAVMADSKMMEQLLSHLENVMVEDHQRLFNVGLKPGHFDLVIGHLSLAMQSLHIDRSLLFEIISILSQFRQIFETGAEEAQNKQQSACHSLRL